MSSLDSDWDRLMDGQAEPESLRDKQIAMLLVHIRHQRDATDQLRAAVAQMPAQISDAVERGLRRVVEDEEVGRRFWERGYDRFSKHATEGISSWVGKRVLMILIAAALSASIGWAVITGRLK